MIALLLLVVVITTIWATFDATAHEGFGTGLVVFLGCAVLWFLAFPLYLVKRGQRERQS